MTQTTRISALLKGAIAVTLGAILFGFLTVTGTVESFNVDSFGPLVNGLRAVPGLEASSAVLTDAGKLRLNRYMLMVLAFVAGFKLDKPGLTWSAVCIAAAFGLRYYQSLIARIVDGTAPDDFAETADLVSGTAGPYFSGGVVRVIVIVGLALAVAGLGNRAIFSIAALAGTLEGVTRLVLGRHWLLDTVAAIPIGLGVLWCLIQIRQILAFDLVGDISDDEAETAL